MGNNGLSEELQGIFGETTDERSLDNMTNFLKLAQEIAWSTYRLPELGGHHSFRPDSWITIPLFQKALEGGPPVHTASWEGSLITNFTQLVNTVSKVVHLTPVKVDVLGGHNQSILLASSSTMLFLQTSERGKALYATVVTNSQENFQKLAAIISHCVVPEDPAKGLVFTLALNMNGYSISRLGAAGTPLIRDNYTPDVLQDYDHIVSDLNTNSPCGRLIILSGEPGTGKTFLVRSLLAAAPKAAFIMVPPHLVEQLNGPEILPALVQAKNETQGPIILIIEDADACLVRREDGNMNAISSLLNLGDGILGAVLDIRILATTNATKLQIDQATQRPGRLCRHTIVGPLDAQTASKALQKLINTGEPWHFGTSQTLARVYQEARKRGWVPPEIVPPRMQERPELLD